VNGQSFLFGDGGEIFRVGRFLVENGVGEIIRLLARVASGAVTNQFLADFGLRFGGRLGIFVILADLAVKASPACQNWSWPIRPWPARDNSSLQMRRS
jgi:hypothetical protein